MFQSLIFVHFLAALRFLRFRSLETMKLTQLALEKNQVKKEFAFQLKKQNLSVIVSLFVLFKKQ